MVVDRRNGRWYLNRPRMQRSGKAQASALPGHHSKLQVPALALGAWYLMDDPSPHPLPRGPSTGHFPLPSHPPPGHCPAHTHTHASPADEERRGQRNSCSHRTRPVRLLCHVSLRAGKGPTQAPSSPRLPPRRVGLGLFGPPPTSQGTKPLGKRERSWTGTTTSRAARDWSPGEQCVPLHKHTRALAQRRCVCVLARSSK